MEERVRFASGAAVLACALFLTSTRGQEVRPLSDDALVDGALPEGLPLWPEDLGRISSAARGRALDLLDRALLTLPEGDRAGEARLLRGLLHMEPLPGRNLGRAREDLALAATNSHPHGSAMARYALARLDEWDGQGDRAAAGYQRVLVDHPEDEAASRAAVGMARTLLRGGSGGRAAALLQEVLDAGADSSLGGADLREAAVRSTLRQSRSGGGWTSSEARPVASGLSGWAALARHRGSDLLVANRKGRAVERYDAAGRIAQRWDLGGTPSVAIDPYERVFVALDSAVLRLEKGGAAIPVAELGDLAPVVSLALDPAGRIFALSRRGGRLGVVYPGEERPRIVRGRQGSPILSLAWDGRRIVALESRTGRLLECGPDASTRVLVEGVALAPVLLAASPGGEIAILERSGDVVFVDGTGRVADRVSTRAAGIEKPSSIALGWDGSLDVYDEKTGRVVRFP